jgi:hypothetical protein
LDQTEGPVLESANRLVELNQTEPWNHYFHKPWVRGLLVEIEIFSPCFNLGKMIKICHIQRRRRSMSGWVGRDLILKDNGYFLTVGTNVDVLF